MRVQHRFSFNVSNTTEDIIEFLNRHRIPYERAKSVPIIVFFAYEDMPVWPSLNALMQQHGNYSLVSPVYSEGELLEATWLRVRSGFRSQYPQPDDNFGYMHSTYDSTHFCKECGCGLIQRDHFRVRRTPAWGRRHFTSLHWVEDELFCTDAAASEVLRLNPKEVVVRPVLQHRTGEPLANINQLQVLHVNEPGWIIHREDFKEEIHCQTCRMTKHVLSGRTQLRFRADVFDQSYDMVRTTERFGVGWFCISLILVSQRMYRIIRSGSLDKDLVFEPIALY